MIAMCHLKTPITDSQLKNIAESIKICIKNTKTLNITNEQCASLLTYVSILNGNVTREEFEYNEFLASVTDIILAGIKENLSNSHNHSNAILNFRYCRGLSLNKYLDREIFWRLVDCALLIDEKVLLANPMEASAFCSYAVDHYYIFHENPKKSEQLIRWITDYLNKINIESLQKVEPRLLTNTIWPILILFDNDQIKTRLDKYMPLIDRMKLKFPFYRPLRKIIFS